MVQIIPNAALIQGTVTAMEPYLKQEGFFIVTVLIAGAGEKEGMRFLGNDLTKKEITILVSGDLQKQLKLQPAINISGEIKKASPVLWRAVEDTWQVIASQKMAAKRGLKK